MVRLRAVTKRCLGMLLKITSRLIPKVSVSDHPEKQSSGGAHERIKHFSSKSKAGQGAWQKAGSGMELPECGKPLEEFYQCRNRRSKHRAIPARKTWPSQAGQTQAHKFLWELWISPCTKPQQWPTALEMYSWGAHTQNSPSFFNLKKEGENFALTLLQPFREQHIQTFSMSLLISSSATKLIFREDAT